MNTDYIYYWKLLTLFVSNLNLNNIIDYLLLKANDIIAGKIRWYVQHLELCNYVNSNFSFESIGSQFIAKRPAKSYVNLHNIKF